VHCRQLCYQLGHEVPHELRREGLGALHVHVVPAGAAVAAAVAGGAAAHEERRRLLGAAAGAVREAEGQRHPAVPRERERLRAELPVRPWGEERVPAAVLVVVPGARASAAAAALHELHKQLPVAHLLVLLPRGGRGLRVQRRHVVHVVAVERPLRRLVSPRFLQPALDIIVVVAVPLIEPGMRRLLVPGELEQRGAVDASDALGGRRALRRHDCHARRRRLRHGAVCPRRDAVDPIVRVPALGRRRTSPRRCRRRRPGPWSPPGTSPPPSASTAAPSR